MLILSAFVRAIGLWWVGVIFVIADAVSLAERFLPTGALDDLPEGWLAALGLFIILIGAFRAYKSVVVEQDQLAEELARPRGEIAQPIYAIQHRMTEGGNGWVRAYLRGLPDREPRSIAPINGLGRLRAVQIERPIRKLVKRGEEPITLKWWPTKMSWRRNPFMTIREFVPDGILIDDHAEIQVEMVFYPETPVESAPDTHTPPRVT